MAHTLPVQTGSPPGPLLRCFCRHSSRRRIFQEMPGRMGNRLLFQSPGRKSFSWLTGIGASDDCGETSATGWHGAAGLQMRGFGAAESLRWLSKEGSQHPGRRLGRKQHFLMMRVACC